MAQKTMDQQTLDLIELANQKKREIKSLEYPRYRTNMSFSYDPISLRDTVNLHVVTDTETLIKIAGFLLHTAAGYIDATAHLNMKDFPEFKWQRFTLNEWISDIKTRLEVIDLTGKRKNLEKIEARLNAIISPELKRQMELEALMEELK